MHYVYVLKSREHNRHYIGMTANLENRLKKHNTGDVRSTKPYRPWNLIHSEFFADKTLARKREIYLKKAAKAREDLFGRF